MPQFGVVAFNAVRLAFARCDLMLARIHELGVGREPVTKVAGRRRRVIDDLLHGFPGTFPHHAEAYDAACGPIYAGDDVGWLFFWVMKV